MPERPASEGGSSGDGASESGRGSRVLLVDWGLAERLAIGLGGSGPEWDGTEEELRSESGRAARLVRRYTGLRPKGRLPAAELVDRREWARVNLESFQDLSAKVEERLEGRMTRARATVGRRGCSGRSCGSRPAPRSASPSAISRSG